jgi:hypothetical protein
MSGRNSRPRRWPAAVVIAVAAVAIAAVLGGPRSGTAASKAVPTNTATPTISGTPQENSTLTAGEGTWTGSPTSFTYAWSRCDKNGDACKAIAGATAKTYQLVAADVDSSIRVSVTAKNADGDSAAATSAPTAVVSPAAAPANTAAPTISGSTSLDSTLTGSKGSWNGNPTDYTYAWSRCDGSGGSCATIGGATGTTYKLTNADVGTTLRFAVTAKNGAGSTTATSVPTAAVTAPPPPVVNGCPSGSGPIQVKDLAPPARLLVDQQTLSPGIVTPSAGSIELRFRVTACGGRPVQGATAWATPIPYNQFSVGQATTGADGFATMTLTRRAGFPAARQQQLLAVFTRATKPGDPLLGGVSTRRLVTFPVRLR